MRLHSIFLEQSSSIEQVLYQRLKKDLLWRMRRKGQELDVWEKLRLLRLSMKDYDAKVRDLLPSFVESAERERVEQRLSSLQWAIHETPEGKELREKWKADRLKQMGTVRQSRGVSISYTPGLRLLFRPPGFGNLKVSSKRSVGAPHNPSEVVLGVLNDGSIVDVYRKKPAPPLINAQPTIAIDFNIG
mmetsp:Transcript_89379/g.257805  ORF Transcript_89379/g.257805 Transcript_89379/m.257805 type:complete len:188 (+) Transcript_89379:1-564(+)